MKYAFKMLAVMLGLGLFLQQAFAVTTQNFGMSFKNNADGEPCFYLSDVSYLRSDGLLELTFSPWLDNIKSTPARIKILNVKTWKNEAMCKADIYYSKFIKIYGFATT